MSNKTDESLSFVNWALCQPNNFGNDQNFVSISYPNFKWGDWSGDTIGEVICQQEIKGKIILWLIKIFRTIFKASENSSLVVLQYRKDLLVMTIWNVGIKL